MSRRAVGEPMKTKDDGIEGEGPRRFIVMALSLGVAVLSMSFLIDAFKGGRASERSGAKASDGPGSIGSIYFRAENDQGESLSGIIETDGTGHRQAFPWVQYEQIAFSPDGTRIAYVDSREDHRGIYVADTDGTNAVRLTDQVNDSWPDWSPDGAKIAFVGTRFDPSIAFCHPGVFADCFHGHLHDGRRRVPRHGRDGGSRVGVRPRVVAERHEDRVRFDPGRRGPHCHHRHERRWFGSADTVVVERGERLRPSLVAGGTQIVFGGIHYEDWGLFEVRPDGTDERTLLFGVGIYAVHPVGHLTGTSSRSVGTSTTTEARRPSTPCVLMGRGSRSSRTCQTAGASGRSCGGRHQRSAR